MMPAQRNTLFGRDKELERLDQVINQPQQKTQVVLVHGPGGCGKTTLCQALKERCLFVSGKADAFHRDIPYRVVVQAFSSLAEWLERQKTLSDAQLDDIKLILQNESKLLAQMVPSLANLAKSLSYGVRWKEVSHSAKTVSTWLSSSCFSVAPDRSDDVSDVAQTERFLLAVTTFLEHFCLIHPLVWFVDDLQWADAATKQLIEAVITTNVPQLTLILGYCDTDDVQLFTSSFKSVDIALNNLSLRVTTEWLTHLLDNAPIAEQLANIVYNQTHGNAYFVLQYLELLQRNRLLVQTEMKWDCNIAELLRATNPADPTNANNGLLGTVSNVISLKISSLPSSTQILLQVASCLGFTFERLILESLLQHCDSLFLMGFSIATPEEEDEDELDFLINPQEEEEDDKILMSGSNGVFLEALDRAIQEGFIEEVDETTLKFTHDRAMETIYESVRNEKERALLHLRIGQHLYDLNDERFIIDAADHYNRGSSLLVHEKERLALIKLNLKASFVAKKRVGAVLMADLLNKAIDVMLERDWDTTYDRVLEVYTLSAEAEHARGRFSLCEKRADTVVAHARSIDDSLRAQVVKMESYGHQRLFPQAIKEAKRLLGQLGENLPSSSNINYLLEYRRTRRLVRSMSDREFTHLKPCKSFRKQMLIKILVAASMYGWNGDTAFGRLVFMRLMWCTLRYGSSEYTAYAFAGYGLMIAAMGNEQEAFTFAERALYHVRSKHSYPRSLMLVCVFLLHLQRPVADCINALLTAYRVGLEVGDLAFGPLAICAYSTLYILVGLPLAPFIPEMRSFGAQLRMCGQDLSLAFVLPMLQLAKNLTGVSDDALMLTWDSCKDEAIFSVNQSLGVDTPSAIILNYAQLFNAYVLNELDVAENASKAARFAVLTGTHFSNTFHAFLDGLLYMALYRERKSKRYLRTAKRILDKFAAIAKRQPVNCMGMLLLLQAEELSFKRDKEYGKEAYDEAISALLQNRFVHFAAIANERASEFMCQFDDSSWSHTYMSRSIALYDKWGAIVKSNQLRERHRHVELELRVAEESPREIRMGDRAESLPVKV